jgi:glyoxylase-like metal-dependent hydrolase (beta-lactamase superfamily II)
MSSTWIINHVSPLAIHAFTAPEDGWLVNSHIVEFPSQLFVIDAQYTLPFAREVVRYTSDLGKPLTRLYVTHYHPDHLLGAAVFDAPMLTIESVAKKIAAVGDRVAREEHEKVGDDIPSKARQPDRTVNEGEEMIEGVKIEYRRLSGAETEDALIIAFPDAATVITQDLVYNRAHLFLGERNFDGWRGALREYRSLPFDVILPGHGAPGRKALYDEMIEYLDFAENSLHRATTAPQFKERMLEGFPSYGCRQILDHQLRFLFP